mmetsp:Transcript_58397/g.132232  ORF Transcript_58397/g.132232 Transcript_58397/m.132232 type:complete len:320 (+) Transcript_58397:617-1576(+)
MASPLCSRPVPPTVPLPQWAPGVGGGGAWASVWARAAFVSSPKARSRAAWAAVSPSHCHSGVRRRLTQPPRRSSHEARTNSLSGLLSGDSFSGKKSRAAASASPLFGASGGGAFSTAPRPQEWTHSEAALRSSSSKPSNQRLQGGAASSRAAPQEGESLGTWQPRGSLSTWALLSGLAGTAARRTRAGGAASEKSDGGGGQGGGRGRALLAPRFGCAFFAFFCFGCPTSFTSFSAALSVCSPKPPATPAGFRPAAAPVRGRSGARCGAAAGAGQARFSWPNPLASSGESREGEGQGLSSPTSPGVPAPTFGLTERASAR